MSELRTHAIAIARTWIGTPYHHQASLKGAGCDCVGLIRGIYRELLGTTPDVPAVYTRDWAEASGEETLLAAARLHLVEIDARNARPGDVLVFRYRAHAVAKHAGLISGPTRMIHASEGATVAEVSLGAWWQRHTAGAFQFPGAA